MPESYLTFERALHPNRKTPTVRVLSKRSGEELGAIVWYGPWRQFCFFPAVGTIFNTGCMTDIQAKIAELMAERRSGVGARERRGWGSTD